MPGWLRPVINYGKAPFFYFFVHFALIHLLARLSSLVRYGTATCMFQSPTLGQYPFTPPPEWGFSLPVVYAVWLFVVAVLYCAVQEGRGTQGDRSVPVVELPLTISVGREHEKHFNTEVTERRPNAWRNGLPP